jgi:hypothetical protein
MKAVLKFNLDDPDDRISHKQCVHANDMAIILWELVYNSRKTIEGKIEDGKEKMDAYTAIDLWHDRLMELLNESSINIDELCV